ncbi:carboxypeptidase [Niveomyces insectorum RCEF 264]|uniref:Carboxypeptidase M14A n=1 Tax=Niveomyces insectorum RCEF 264 TaxID=1081102 RepID=A0A167QWA3_9HYPO|nr:carboxypeptidase [Niveomyces insectorum RCEF 264]
MRATSFFVLPFVALAPAAGATAVAKTRAASQRVSYDGFKVLRVPVSHANLHAVNSAIDDLGLSTWQDSRKPGRFADVVVPPAQATAFAERLGSIDTATTETTMMMHDDLGAAIAEEMKYGAYEAGSLNDTWFHTFHPYEDHLQFLHDLQALYPNNSEIVTSGTSLDGRTITGIRMFGRSSSSSSNKTRPKAVVFHGTVHAREWIATMVVEYLAYQLLHGYHAGTASGVNDTSGFLDTYDIYAFPIVNPDGFVYTQTTDRLWRKNRQTTSNSSCVGRDINRNWPIAWAAGGGSSEDPCAPDYRGGAQADAPETAALTTWLHGVQQAQGIKLYIDYHSYGQLFMTPYGYTCEAAPARSKALLALADGAAAAIYDVHGVYFQSGSICSMLYKSTGNSVDYVHDVIGAENAFTSELRDMGQTGFVLPPAQILPSCEESYAGVQYLLQTMD